MNSRFKPIESDSLQQSVWFSLDDRFKGQINYRQDTWSGATPIATAPREWRGNRSAAPDGVSGASPYLVPGSDLFLDAKTRQPLRSRKLELRKADGRRGYATGAHPVRGLRAKPASRSISVSAANGMSRRWT